MKNSSFAIISVFSFGLLFCLVSCISQQSIVETREKMYLGKDPFGHDFFIENQVLSKTTFDDSTIYQYPLRRFSRNIHLDWNNPFKLLLHYKDFNSIDFLDKELNLLNTLDLNTLELGRIHSIAYAGQNGYWIYADNAFTIYRYTENLDLIQEVNVQLLVNNAQDILSLHQYKDVLHILTVNEIILLSENGQVIRRCPLGENDTTRRIFQNEEMLYMIEQNVVSEVSCRQ